MPEQTEKPIKKIKKQSDHAVLVKYVTNQAWGMNLDTLQHLCNILERHVAGIKLSADEVAAAIESPDKNKDQWGYTVTLTGRAIIPVTGVIAKYSSMVNGVSTPEGTSVEQINEHIDMALADTKVKAIIFKIESPGGSIAGVPSLANKIYQAGFVKPTIAYVDDFAASAAYWLASQCNMIYSSDVATVGSIGVYTVVVDSSKRAEQLGLKFHIIRSGDNKGIGQPGVEITEGNVEALQEWINDTYEAFLSAIMRARGEMGLDNPTLRTAADGRSFVASKALEMKLIDGIKSFDELAGMDLPGLRMDVAAIALAETLTQQKIKELQMTEKAETSKAAAAERERINAITLALNLPGLEAVSKNAIDSDMSVDAAKAIAFDELVKIHAGEIAAVRAELKTANDKLAAVTAGAPETLRAAEAIDTKEGKLQAETDDGKAETYQAKVKALVTLGKSKAAAFRQAAHDMPKSHQAWVDAQPKVKT